LRSDVEGSILTSMKAKVRENLRKGGQSQIPLQIKKKNLKKASVITEETKPSNSFVKKTQGIPTKYLL